MNPILRNSALQNSVKPKLLILTSSFPCEPEDETCGYIRDFARNLAKEFQVQVLAPADAKAKQWPCDLFTLSCSGSPLPGRLNPFQATCDFNSLLTDGLMVKLGVALSLIFFFLRAFKLALRADVICSHWLVPCGLAGSIISRLLGKPHVAVEHSGALHLLSRIRGGARLARFTLGGSDYVITVSANLKMKLVALCPDAQSKVAVIPMGISNAREMRCRSLVDTSSRRRIVLFIGRLTRIKGLDVLLKAMHTLSGLRLVVAGDGECRNEFERLARDLSVDALFMGRVGSIQRDHLLSISDAVVIPSLELPDGRTEGMPVVCLEAMAANRVVIASRVGGLTEIISDNENGILFNPGDHLDLQAKLLGVLDDGSFAQSLCANARQTAAEFEWSKIGARYADVIKAALINHSEPGVRDTEIAPCLETESESL